MPSKGKWLLARSLVSGLQQLTFIAFLLLLPAGLLPGGTWYWRRAWGFLLVYGLLLLVSSIVLARRSPGSLEARLMQPFTRNHPAIDQFATLLLLISISVWFLTIPLEVFYWRLLPVPGIFVACFGLALCAMGFFVLFSVLLRNRFAAPIVADQSGRGQSVVQAGFYAHIRHPFYFGMVLWFAGIALWLQSYLSFLALPLILVALMFRISVEDRLLCKTLDGYMDYMRKVRYRIIPYVW